MNMFRLDRPISCYTLKLSLERDFPEQQQEDNVYEVDPLDADGNSVQVFCNISTGKLRNTIFFPNLGVPLNLQARLIMAVNVVSIETRQ